MADTESPKAPKDADTPEEAIALYREAAEADIANTVSHARDCVEAVRSAVGQLDTDDPHVVTVFDELAKVDVDLGWLDVYAGPSAWDLDLAEQKYRERFANGELPEA